MEIQTEIQLDAKSLNRLLDQMKELEPNSLAAMRKRMRTMLSDEAGQIKRNVPTESPFKGMRQNYYGKVQWEQPKVRVATTPGSSTRRREWAPVVTLIATGNPKLGFDYTELAGVRKRPPRPRSKPYARRPDGHLNTTQGEALIRKAREVSKHDYKAGHFAYGKFLELRPQMLIKTSLILDEVADKFNQKVKRI